MSVADLRRQIHALAIKVAAATGVPTTRQIVAGTGLSGGGDLSADRTLTVDTATIATRAYADAGDASTLASAETYADTGDAGRVPTSRTLTAGTNLTGGGDLSANRTFALDPNPSMTTVTASGLIKGGSGQITGLGSGAVLSDASGNFTSGDPATKFDRTARDISADSGSVSLGALTKRAYVWTGTPAADASFTTSGAYEGQYVEINNTTSAPYIQTFNGLWIPPANVVGCTYTNGAWRYAAGGGGAFAIKVSQTVSATFSGVAIFRVPAYWVTKPAGCGERVHTAMVGASPSAFTLTDQSSGDLVPSFTPGAANSLAAGGTAAYVDSTAARNITASGTVGAGTVTQNLIHTWILLVQDMSSL